MIDRYKHLNQDERVEIGIEDVAAQVVAMNYGVHRMLSAIVRRRLEMAGPFGDDELAIALRDLLERGLF